MTSLVCYVDFTIHAVIILIYLCAIYFFTDPFIYMDEQTKSIIVIKIIFCAGLIVSLMVIGCA